MVQSTKPLYEDVLVSLGLDGTIVTIYDQNISRAVECMHAFPHRLIDEAMQKLGKPFAYDRNLSGRFEGLPFADEILP